MRALFYLGTQQMELREVDEPSAGAGEVIVDLSHCGICGSDMHAYHGKDERRVPPLILGHEAVGVPRAGRFAGQRVAINPLLTCGRCDDCLNGRQQNCAERTIISMRRPGGFAEMVAMPESNLWPIPDDLASQTAALMEPLAVAVHTADMARRQATRGLHQHRCVILGGGAIGLLCMLVLQAQGARDLWIAETNPTRRATLAGLGPVQVYDPITQSPGEQTADILIDAVGSKRTRHVAASLVRTGGCIVHVGLEDNNGGLDTRDMTLREISFVGTYCYGHGDLREALNLLSQGLCDRRDWIENRPLAAGADAFRDIHNGNAPPKIILDVAA